MGELKKRDCISVKRAQEQLGITRNTVESWINALGIEKHRFTLDTKVYIAIDDYERLQQFKAEKEED